MKKCSKCKVKKPKVAFNKLSTSKDGLYYSCKECRAKYRKNLKDRKEEDIKTPDKKRCYCCGETKSSKSFNKYNGKLDGLTSECKKCSNKKEKGRRAKISKSKKIKIKRKICCKCKVEKDINKFHKYKYSKDGFSFMCSACNTIKCKEYTDSLDPKIKKARSKKYKIKNKDKVYTRNCPSCNKTLTYTTSSGRNKCEKNKSRCSKRCGKEKAVTKKRCAKCKKTKSSKRFYKSKPNLDGLHSWCKDCRAQSIKKQKQKNKNRTRYDDKKCIDCKKTKAGSLFTKHSHSPDGLSSRCLECDSIKHKEYSKDIANIKNKKPPDKKRCYVCKEIKLVKYFNKNKYSIDGIDNKCKSCNSTQCKKYKKPYKDMSVKYKLADNIRSRVRKLLINKPAGTIEALGCSIDNLIKHLEEQFYPHKETKEEMTWDNKGLFGWHIDHIIPLSSFDLTDREQFLKACHYTNLQPLWAEENLKKGDKLITKLP